jgi:hypothetical protein
MTTSLSCSCRQQDWQRGWQLSLVPPSALRLKAPAPLAGGAGMLLLTHVMTVAIND